MLHTATHVLGQTKLDSHAGDRVQVVAACEYGAVRTTITMRGEEPHYVVEIVDFPSGVVVRELARGIFQGWELDRAFKQRVLGKVPA